MSHAIGLQDFDNGWLPIETAPKDGTEILLHANDRPKGQSMCVAFWHGEYGWLFFDNGLFHLGVQDNITHWRHLPPHPKEIE